MKVNTTLKHDEILSDAELTRMCSCAGYGAAYDQDSIATVCRALDIGFHSRGSEDLHDMDWQ